jgi:hypothetical protein
MTTTLLALALTGATYEIQWETEYYYLSGVIDTETDTLTWDALPPDHFQSPNFWANASPVWPAVTHGDRIPGMEEHYEILPYDIPDDWSGVLDKWGFISDAGGTTYAGLGCRLSRWACIHSTGYCNGQVMTFARTPGPDWTIAQIQGAPHHQLLFGPARVNLTPVSSTRAIGDANFNGIFDSSDLVTVFANGKYETGEEAWWTEGDWDQNGLFNSGDMITAFVAGDYEQPAMVVPEPSAMVLFLIGLAAMRRRRCGLAKGKLACNPRHPARGCRDVHPRPES